MPMRVKTPWIDALTQSREAEKAGPEEKVGQSVKPDVSPKKMSDSYYSAVRVSSGVENGMLILTDW
jgi:acyl-coenzyme A thioesterase 9